MKKVFFLAVIAMTLSFSSFAQTKEMILNPGEKGNIITTPCPNYPMPVIADIPIVKKRKPNRNIWYPTPASSSSVSNTNSNNTTFLFLNIQNPAKDTVVQKPIVEEHRYFGYGWGPLDWLGAFLLSALVLGGLILLIAFLYHKLRHHKEDESHETLSGNPHNGLEKAQADVKSNGGKITVDANGYTAEYTKPEPVVELSAEEVEKGMTRAEAAGGTFVKEPKCYRIEFPKPEKPAEEKKD